MSVPEQDPSRSEQIRARLAIGVTSWGDVRWLLAERDELLARVEAAERAGTVKALEDLARDCEWRAIESMTKSARYHHEWRGKWATEQAQALRNGAPL